MAEAAVDAYRPGIDDILQVAAESGLFCDDDTDDDNHHHHHRNINSSSNYDVRSAIPPFRIVYRNLHKFRVAQMMHHNSLCDVRSLSDEQWGLKLLDKCHHISTTSTCKDGPQSYRVRICKTCCQEDSHIELGTYVDQESAILVNDTYEILSGRLDKLIVLRSEDKPFLQMLTAKKYDRSKGRDYGSIMDLIAERIAAIDGKKRTIKLLPPPMPSLSLMGMGSSSSSSLKDLLIHRTTAEVSPSSYLLSPDDASSEQQYSGYPSEADLPSMPTVNSYHTTDHHHADGGGGGGDIGCIGETAMMLHNPACDGTYYGMSGNYYDMDDTAGCDDNTVAWSIDQQLSDQQLSDLQLSEQETLETMLALGRLSTVCVSQPQSNYSSSTKEESNLYLAPMITCSSPSSSVLTSVIVADSDVSVHDDLDVTADQMEVSDVTSAGDLYETKKTAGTGRDYFPSDDWTSTAGEYFLSPRKRAATFSVGGRDTFISPHFNYYADHYDVDDGVHHCKKHLSSTSGTATSQRRSMSFHGKTPIAMLTWLASMHDDEVDVAKSLYELGTNSTCFSYSNSSNDVFDDEGRGGDLSMYSIQADVLQYNSHQQMFPSISTEQYQYLTQQPSISRRRVRSNSMPVLQPHLSSCHQWKTKDETAAAAASSTASTSTTTTIRPHGNWNRKVDPLSVALKKYYDRCSASGSSKSLVGYVGIYSPEDRRVRIERFWEKKKRRVWAKKVKYDVRKNFADSRIRVKGRFVKKVEEDAVVGLSSSSVGYSAVENDQLNDDDDDDDDDQLNDDDGEDGDR